MDQATSGLIGFVVFRGPLGFLNTAELICCASEYHGLTRWDSENGRRAFTSRERAGIFSPAVADRGYLNHRMLVTE